MAELEFDKANSSYHMQATPCLLTSVFVTIKGNQQIVKTMITIACVKATRIDRFNTRLIGVTRRANSELVFLFALFYP